MADVTKNPASEEQSTLDMGKILAAAGFAPPKEAATAAASITTSDDESKLVKLQSTGSRIQDHLFGQLSTFMIAEGVFRKTVITEIAQNTVNRSQDDPLTQSERAELVGSLTIGIKDSSPEALANMISRNDAYQSLINLVMNKGEGITSDVLSELNRRVNLIFDADHRGLAIVKALGDQAEHDPDAQARFEEHVNNPSTPRALGLVGSLVILEAAERARLIAELADAAGEGELLEKMNRDIEADGTTYEEVHAAFVGSVRDAVEARLITLEDSLYLQDLRYVVQNPDVVEEDVLKLLGEGKEQNYLINGEVPEALFKRAVLLTPAEERVLNEKIAAMDSLEALEADRQTAFNGWARMAQKEVRAICMDESLTPEEKNTRISEVFDMGFMEQKEMWEERAEAVKQAQQRVPVKEDAPSYQSTPNMGTQGRAR